MTEQNKTNISNSKPQKLDWDKIANIAITVISVLAIISWSIFIIVVLFFHDKKSNTTTSNQGFLSDKEYNLALLSFALTFLRVVFSIFNSERAIRQSERQYNQTFIQAERLHTERLEAIRHNKPLP